MVDIVMAYIVMACVVMAYIVMAYIVMAYIVIAYIVRPNLSLETNELKQTKRGCALFIRKQTEPFVQKNQLATSPKQILFTGIATSKIFSPVLELCSICISVCLSSFVSQLKSGLRGPTRHVMSGCRWSLPAAWDVIEGSRAVSEVSWWP